MEILQNFVAFSEYMNFNCMKFSKYCETLFVFTSKSIFLNCVTSHYIPLSAKTFPPSSATTFLLMVKVHCMYSGTGNSWFIEFELIYTIWLAPIALNNSWLKNFSRFKDFFIPYVCQDYPVLSCTVRRSNKNSVTEW